MGAFETWCKTLETAMPGQGFLFRQAAKSWEQGRGRRAAGDAAAALRKELERIRRYEDTGAYAADLTLAEHLKQAKDKLSAAYSTLRELGTTVGKPFLAVKMPALLAKGATMVRPVGDFVENAVDSAAGVLGCPPGVGKIVRKAPHIIIYAVGGTRGLIRDRKAIAEKAKAFGKAAREAARAVAPVVAEGFRRAAAKVRAGAARVGDALRSGAQWARAAACHVGAAIQRGAIAVAGRVGGWLKAALG